MTEYKEQGPDHRIIALKERLSTAGIRGLALDIDETLAWTVGHWAAELKRRFGGPEGMSVEEIVDKHKYTQHVPD
ncbi:MAG: hypothetical protein KDA96_28650, partial [Planctomycetaceae bacterium]|nr:hypothetical protein [Planctomycetaceae bacterium]